MLYTQNESGEFLFPHGVSESDLLSVAETVIAKRYARGVALTSPNDAREYCRSQLICREREHFLVIYLDQRHRLIESEVLFSGTISSCTVTPREIVRGALLRNAAAVMCSHNHPSGAPDPSAADIELTAQLKAALALLDIRLLDHLIVGYPDVVSMAERGLV